MRPVCWVLRARARQICPVLVQIEHRGIPQRSDFPHTRKRSEVRWIVMATRKTSKRTVIEPNPGDRRYVRRNRQGEFKQEVNVGRSLAADRRRTAKTKVKKGQGDRGDVAR
jgi:hypothetical protein